MVRRRGASVLWAPADILLRNPGPREVIEAWGFCYRTGFVWDKVVALAGPNNELVHEHLLVATRGDGLPDTPHPLPKSVFRVRQAGAHPAKPAEIRAMIERQYRIGPHLEIFGTESAEGWDVFGGDPRLWTTPAGSSTHD